MEKKEYSIGYIDNGYPSYRMIYKKINWGNIRYIKMSGKNDVRYIFFHLISKVIRTDNIEKKRKMYSFMYKPDFHPQLDVLHIFNGICQTRKIPWVSTFEAECPTYFEYKDVEYANIIANAIKYIKNENCIAILFMSEWAKNQTKIYWKKYMFEDEYKKCEKKFKVIQPPQKLVITQNEVIDKFSSLTNSLELVFVGNEFWRKGGKELIEILDRYAEDYKFNLTIISNLSYTSYSNLSTHNGEKIITEKFIDEKKWITLKKNIDNKEVLKILKKSHIGFLPTYADTYGFSVLEMQAAGCPVVTTNVNALKEINNNEIGWVIEVPLKEENCTNKDYEQKVHNALMDKLDCTIKEVLNSKYENYKEKAIKCLDKIEKVNSPEKYGEKLFEIYNSNMEKLYG